jgi:hypothetical protein
MKEILNLTVEYKLWELIAITCTITALTTALTICTQEYFNKHSLDESEE